MKHVRALLEIVFFVMFCLVVDVNSAQVNSADHNYRFGEVHERNAWHDGEDMLTSQSLKAYLARLPGMNILRELARMLLAQIPAAGGVNYNVAENNDVAYVTLDRIADVYKSCGELKNHLLEHGHLGYFPIFSVINEKPLVKVNKLVPRGIFRVRPNIIQRVMTSQQNTLHWVTHGGNNLEILNRLPNYLSNLGFYIDPIIPFPAGLAPNIINALNVIIPRQPIPHIGLNLENFTNRMINGLLTDNTILPGNLIVNPVQANDNFTIDVTYNNFGGNGIGIDQNGALTNRVRIVIKVLHGIISIVTMYPI